MAMAKAEKEKKVIKEEEEKEEEEEEDDDDGPPPILEREESCGENGEDDEKEEDGGATRSTGEIAAEPVIGNLMEALAGVFSADSDSPAGKKRKYNVVPKQLGTRGPLPKSFLGYQTARPASVSPMLSSRTAPPTRSMTSVPAKTTAAAKEGAEKSKYGLPPPIPPSLRGVAASLAQMNGVGSNTSLGPARLLENRKRQLNGELTLPGKRTSLEVYNGGRAGEKFNKKVPSTASSSGASTSPSTSATTTAFDVHSMLAGQPPVQMQVSVGADNQNSSRDTMQEALALAVHQKESIMNVAKNATNHTLLIGTMVMNGLATLQATSPEDFKNFSGDLFSLFTKYNIH
ncbi:unnamed protein product [Caenorhabditis nigoni]